MSSSSGYEDEMGRFLTLSDEELSRLLAGEAGVGDEAFEGVASIVTELRGSYAASVPDEATRASHIAAMSGASQLAADKGNPTARPVSKVHGPVSAQVSGLPKWRRVMDRTVSLALKGLAGTVAASMSLMGLAYAGVDLPGQAAERAFEAITGLELPNQASEQAKSVTEGVRSVIESDLEGCERGQAIADAADANRQDDARTDTDPCAQDDGRPDGRGSKATGEEKSAAGRAEAAEASGGRSEAGADNAGTNDDSGRSTAEEASTSGQETGSSKSQSGGDHAGSNDDSGRSTAEDWSNSGQEKGSSQAEEAQGNNPTGNGRP